MMNVKEEVLVGCGTLHQEFMLNCFFCTKDAIGKLCEVIENNEKFHREEIRKMDRQLREVRKTAAQALGTARGAVRGGLP